MAEVWLLPVGWKIKMSVSVSGGRLPGGRDGIRWLGVKVRIGIENLLKRLRLLILR